MAGAVAGAAGGYAYRATRPASAGQQALADAEAGGLPPVPFHGPYQASQPGSHQPRKPLTP